MSKVLIFGDLHVHCHKRSTDRLQNCLDTLNWIFTTAKERGAKSVVCVGDLFHDREKIEILTYQRTFELFEKHLSDGSLTAYLLLGNHDMWHAEKWDVSSIFPLRSINGVTVIDKPCTVEIDGKPVSFLPYTHNPVGDTATIVNPAKHRVLFGHVAIDGALLNTVHDTMSEVAIEHDGDMVKVDSAIFNGWHQVFLGHYHAEQRLGDNQNVEYVGSPLQLSFGECFQHKHVVLYDLDSHEKKYIRNEFSPKHFIIPLADVAKYELKNNFVKVLVEDISKADLIDVQAEIAKKYDPAFLKMEQSPHADNKQIVADAKSILFKHDEMLEKWLEVVGEFGIVGMEREKLLTIGRSICQLAKAKPHPELLDD